MKQRVQVEVHWLIALSQAKLPDFPSFSANAEAVLLKLVADFSDVDAERVKAIEAVTNHDVKAVEYWMKEKVVGHAELEKASEFIHFACTSEDINNTSHGLMLKGARQEVILPRKTVLEMQRLLSDKEGDIHMQFAANQAKFSFDGKDFIRTDTTLITEDGESAVGTKLDHNNSGYKALLKKKSWSGKVTLFGKEYDSNYAPLTDNNGKLIGALNVFKDAD